MNEKISPPVCEKHPKVLSIHNDQRTDNYFWLNNRKDSKVIDYLNAENNYTNKVLEETENIQEKLYKELKSRIKKMIKVFHTSGTITYIGESSKKEMNIQNIGEKKQMGVKMNCLSIVIQLLKNMIILILGIMTSPPTMS